MTAMDGDAKRVLEERARLLAQPIVEQSAATDGIDLLLFSRAGTTYAVEADVVAEVVSLADATPLVSVPAAIVGVVNHRGRIVAVVDVAALLPHDSADTADAGFVVVVRPPGAWFALRADAVPGVVWVDESDLRPASDLADGGHTPVRALTADLTAILDVEALARDPRVEVEDEVE